MKYTLWKSFITILFNVPGSILISKKHFVLFISLPSTLYQGALQNSKNINPNVLFWKRILFWKYLSKRTLKASLKWKSLRPINNGGEYNSWFWIGMMGVGIPYFEDLMEYYLFLKFFFRINIGNDIKSGIILIAKYIWILSNKIIFSGKTSHCLFRYFCGYFIIYEYFEAKFWGQMVLDRSSKYVIATPVIPILN